MYATGRVYWKTTQASLQIPFADACAYMRHALTQSGFDIAPGQAETQPAQLESDEGYASTFARTTSKEEGDEWVTQTFERIVSPLWVPVRLSWRVSVDGEGRRRADVSVRFGLGVTVGFGVMYAISLALMALLLWINVTYPETSGITALALLFVLGWPLAHTVLTQHQNKKMEKVLWQHLSALTPVRIADESWGQVT